MVREVTLVFLRDQVLVGNPTPNGQPWNHGHISNTKQTQEVVFMHVCICNNNSQKKDIMKLKGSKGEIWEGLEEGEKKWNNIITF